MSGQVVDFEESDDELQLEEREAEHDDRTTQDYSATATVDGNNSNNGKTKQKGRGFASQTSEEDRYSGRGGKFDGISKSGSRGKGPARSVEGWIVFVTGIHEEAQEEDVLDEFREFGEVKNIDVNIDRRTGYLKGYGMVEYAKFAEAEEAINSEVKVMGKPVSCSWCFTKGASR